MANPADEASPLLNRMERANDFSPLLTRALPALEADVEVIESRGYLGAAYSVERPTASEPIRSLFPGRMNVMVEAFNWGLHFPLHSFILSAARLMGLALIQLTPESIGMLVAFTALCMRHGFEPSLPLFAYFYSVKYAEDRLQWYFVSRKEQRLLLDFPGGPMDYVPRFVSILHPSFSPPAWGHSGSVHLAESRLEEGDRAAANFMLTLGAKERDREELLSQTFLRETVWVDSEEFPAQDSRGRRVWRGWL